MAMKVGGSRSGSNVGKITGVGGATSKAPAAAGGTVGPARGVAASASVMGIPEPEFTPKVREAIMSLMAEVHSLRQQLERTASRLADLEKLADEDALVPMPNRRAFVRELSRLQSYSQRYKVPASLIFFDVNGFKSINDTYGHAAGDAALLTVAQTLVDNLRESDIVGRLGGDEFGVILVQADDTVSRDKAEQLATAISARPVHWEDKTLALSVAYGVYPLGGGEDPGEALAAADKAMYAHKQASKAKR